MLLRPIRLLAPIASLLIAVFAVAGCQTPPPQQTLPDITFAHLPAIELDVGRLALVSEYQSPAVEPHVDHLMPISPAGAMQRWAQDRLKPMGSEGWARLIIKDAKVVEVPLTTDQSVTGLFKSQQEMRYDATLDVVVQLLDERQLPLAEVKAQVTRSRSVPEGITLNEREKVWHEMVDDMVQNMNAQLEPAMRNYMGRWIM